DRRVIITEGDFYINMALLDMIENQLEFPTDSGKRTLSVYNTTTYLGVLNVNQAVSPINQLLLALRYYATGSDQLSVADYTRVSKSNSLKNRPPNLLGGDVMQNDSGIGKDGLEAAMTAQYLIIVFKEQDLKRAYMEIQFCSLMQDIHIRTRNVVERLFGSWKRRFPVLAVGINVKLDNAFPIIVATAVLHNILRRAGNPHRPKEFG
ncbi:hypothetical protein L9F63_027467, partial [Diploptera punctata]